MLFIRIRELRAGKRLTAKQVADYLEIGEKLYSDYEEGKRSIPVKFLIKLALFYQTSVDYILGYTNNPVPYERREKK